MASDMRTSMYNTRTEVTTVAASSSTASVPFGATWGFADRASFRRPGRTTAFGP